MAKVGYFCVIFGQTFSVFHAGLHITGFHPVIRHRRDNKPDKSNSKVTDRMKIAVTIASTVLQAT